MGQMKIDSHEIVTDARKVIEELASDPKTLGPFCVDVDALEQRRCRVIFARLKGEALESLDKSLGGNWQAIGSPTLAQYASWVVAQIALIAMDYDE
jgi:hypothetical protein